ncbi:hypothetical protein CAPTEDRAFT_221378 [Capitella teleta]|uniref:Collagen IV NC1 domain-containing protein n=1 Tax=Capitella teleta TaxID=283909 RepID=R7TCR1_CAPTE|nr:hypothetical protein CAPTEDRAFT_221378 [Capitella teleta]|eukprot:ELT91533.1 hypothetical protein CAPTEDRAFT_221378 [Capitella teleta]
MGHNAYFTQGMRHGHWCKMALRLLCALLWIQTVFSDSMGLPYKYLDNNLYAVTVGSDPDRESNAILLGIGGTRFPPPPIFPPPPPALDGDTNTLLRQAIFNNLEMRMKGENSIEPIEKDYGSGVADVCNEYFSMKEKNDEPIGPEPQISPIGLPGPPGEKGSRGRRGKKGPMGPKGDQGPAGIQGPVGPVGPQGLTGLPGEVGPKGSPGIAGPKGSRGRRGSKGHHGQPGSPGERGLDGVPGLVVFPDATSMFGVQLEGLVAYRSDVKQLYFRDHVTWRAIRITKCGDGILDREQGEQCDDGNEDYHDACIACRKARCGDGIRHHGHEQCDGRDFGNQSCASLRNGMTGTLICTSKCQISYQRCRFIAR